VLAQKGSLYVTRPTLFTYANSRETIQAMARDVFDLVLAGKIKSEARQEYPLREAAAAHRALESRVTTGATVLLP
jgi:NADPH2:quinone reductase